MCNESSEKKRIYPDQTGALGSKGCQVSYVKKNSYLYKLYILIFFDCVLLIPDVSYILYNIQKRYKLLQMFNVIYL